MTTPTSTLERGWYVVHCQSGWEDRVKNAIETKVALESLRKLRPLVDRGILRGRIEFFGRRLDETFGGDPRVAEIRQRGFACYRARRHACKGCERQREKRAPRKSAGGNWSTTSSLCRSWRR